MALRIFILHDKRIHQLIGNQEYVKAIHRRISEITYLINDSKFEENELNHDWASGSMIIFIPGCLLKYVVEIRHLTNNIEGLTPLFFLNMMTCNQVKRIQTFETHTPETEYLSRRQKI
ncbi:hypothetical protein RF11_05520 [Thelohanellus kitauei]|uniref:Uncharacterized protein n=1 Tax=Thelohanellus kitauei TaxID=669202 RepID=A0A0C2MKF7_THEKT|nr:hypothetical protein RF11_05520 [Thelohanellus kitauei]